MFISDLLHAVLHLIESVGIPPLMSHFYARFDALANHSNESSTALGEAIEHDGPLPARALLLTVAIAVSLSMIILLTILGNILVLTALRVDLALRSPTHLLMGNLACADLLLGNFSLPDQMQTHR